MYGVSLYEGPLCVGSSYLSIINIHEPLYSSVLPGPRYMRIRHMWVFYIGIRYIEISFMGVRYIGIRYTGILQNVKSPDKLTSTVGLVGGGL